MLEINRIIISIVFVFFYELFELKPTLREDYSRDILSRPYLTNSTTIRT
jgi:hypothetical protein